MVDTGAESTWINATVLDSGRLSPTFAGRTRHEGTSLQPWGGAPRLRQRWPRGHCGEEHERAALATAERCRADTTGSRCCRSASYLIGRRSEGGWLPRLEDARQARRSWRNPLFFCKRVSGRQERLEQVQADQFVIVLESWPCINSAWGRGVRAAYIPQVPVRLRYHQWSLHHLHKNLQKTIAIPAHLV